MSFLILFYFLYETQILIYKKMISNKKLTNQDLADIIKNLAKIQYKTNEIITKLDSTITKFEQYHYKTFYGHHHNHDLRENVPNTNAPNW